MQCIIWASATSVVWELHATKPKPLNCIAMLLHVAMWVHCTTWLSSLRSALEVECVGMYCVFLFLSQFNIARATCH